MKLELKHISPYLPYRLEISPSQELYNKGVKGSIACFFPDNKESLECRYQYGTKTMSIESSKPILRPLSDLTKEIEHNGERFVPMESLQEDNRGYVSPSLGNTTRQPLIDFNKSSYWIVCQLHEWHFDTQKLIENGLAINKNTLES